MFLSHPVRSELLTKYFGQELVDRALECHFLREENGLVSAAFDPAHQQWTRH